MSTLRSLAARQAIGLLDAGGLLAWSRRQVARQGLIVLTLHRVVPDHDVAQVRSPRGMVLRESLFAGLLAYLSANAVVLAAKDIAEIDPARRIDGDVRPRVLLTFDDGWKDNYSIAWPLLQQAQMTAVFFVTTQKLGRETPFWPERFTGVVRAAAEARRLPALLIDIEAFLQRSGAGSALRSQLMHTALTEQPLTEAAIRLLKQVDPPAIEDWLASISARYGEQRADPWEALCTWEELRAMAKQGAVIASHTAHHALLPQVSAANAQQELAQSRDDLAAQGLCDQWIAYPNGDCSPATTRAAVTAGYQLGFLNRAGLWNAATPSLLIPRINLWDGTLAGADGSFSASRFEYAAYWKTLRTERRSGRLRGGQRACGPSESASQQVGITTKAGAPS